MQKLFKDKKKIVLVSLIAVLVVTGVIVGVVALNGQSAEKVPPDTETSGTSDITVSVPEIPDDTDSATEEDKLPEEIEDDGSALKPDESVLPTESKTQGDKADTNDTPVSEAEPPQPDANESGVGIVIGDGGSQTEVYSCGCENHHCNAPETHAYIQNLELEGCPFCGSHSCPSFYAVDQWGNAVYRPIKCPQYEIKKDPVEYCQACGRKNGNGDNNTCQKWIIDFACPMCGETVPANECHTHSN